MIELEELRHLCRIDLIQQAGYHIKTQEFPASPPETTRYMLTSKKGGVQFDLGRPLRSSEMSEGVKELYDIMIEQGVLGKYNDWYSKQYSKHVEELWRKLRRFGPLLLSQIEIRLFCKWRLELAGVAGVEYLGVTILEVLAKAMAHLDPAKTSPTTVENENEKESLSIVEKDGKMILHLNGAPIPNLESCWITPRENGALEVEITYTIEPKG